MRFAATLSPERITYENSVSDGLKVIVLAVAPETDLPLRDGTGKAVTTFKASEALIRGAISSFHGGIFNVDHKSIPETMIGVYDSVIYDNGFKVSGSILCPIWKEKIISGDYSGVSIEGTIVGEMKNPESMNIYAISFLTNEENPQGGACQSVDENGNPLCVVEVDEPEVDASWDGSSAEKQIWNYVEDKDGNVVSSKAKKCFLKVDGDAKQKDSYSYPYVTISNGKPVPNREALISALKYASGARGAEKDATLIRKIKSIMTKNNMDLPPSLQARLEQSVTIEDGQRKIVASVFDPTTDELLDSKQVLIINDIEKGEEKMEEVKVEAEGIVPGVEPKIEASVPEATPAAVVETPAESAPVAEVAPSPPMIDWELVSKELGIKSKEEFSLIKQTADRVPELEKKISPMEQKIDAILKENSELRSYKDDQTKKMLLDMYPPAITQDIAATFAEYVKDPLAFTQKYAEDAVKFAASKNVKLQGSAVESELSEEARKMAVRKEKRDKFLNKTGGPVV